MHAMLPASLANALRLAQQLRQLGDVGGDSVGSSSVTTSAALRQMSAMLRITDFKSDIARLPGRADRRHMQCSNLNLIESIFVYCAEFA